MLAAADGGDAHRRRGLGARARARRRLRRPGPLGRRRRPAVTVLEIESLAILTQFVGSTWQYGLLALHRHRRLAHHQRHRARDERGISLALLSRAARRRRRDRILRGRARLRDAVPVFLRRVRPSSRFAARVPVRVIVLGARPRGARCSCRARQPPAGAGGHGVYAAVLAAHARCPARAVRGPAEPRSCRALNAAQPDGAQEAGASSAETTRGPTSRSCCSPTAATSSSPGRCAACATAASIRLYVFSDGPADSAAEADVGRVRELLRRSTGRRSSLRERAQPRAQRLDPHRARPRLREHEPPS